MTGERKYLYGPVPSRRLGLSYGIDIVPFKVCTLDCVYCQLGRTAEKTTRRRDFGPVEPVLTELREALATGREADFVTIGGSGEPTLHLRLGELVDGIKKVTDIPVALLTNGTLLYRPDVRADCAKVDVAMPSLDAADEQTFRRIDRPEPTISIESIISGLCKFRKEFGGQIWLEIFLVRSINTGSPQIARIKEAIGRIKPDKVQLNTAVRPTADPSVVRLRAEELHEIAAQLGPGCEVVAGFSRAANELIGAANEEDELGHHCLFCNKRQTLLSMLKRRPCSLDDISASLSMSRIEVAKYVADLQDRGLIQAEDKGGQIFFKSTS
ncbi:MAG: radical SAM protein [Phycisphaerales bacterium]|nr:MAG: radical SAM protein [Phycisphaerales bacterium]